MRGRRLLEVAAAAALVAAAGILPSAAQEVSVRATVEPQPVREGEELVLTVEVSGASVSSLAPPDVSPIEDFVIARGPSVSSRFQWINGRTSSARSFSYVLRPKRAGTLSIPPLAVLVQGRTWRTRALEVQVVAGGAPPVPPRPAPGPGFGAPPPSAAPARPRGAGEPDIRVRVEVDERTVYVGQQVTARFILDTQTEVLNVGLKDTPSFPGFWAEEVKVPDNYEMRRTQIGGQPYIEYTLMKKALFPTSAGTLTVPAVAYQIQVRRRTQDPIESFFFTPTETVVRRTDPVTLTVLPLPERGRPEGFSGAVGSFTLAATADRKDSKVNDAIGVKVRIAGEGNLNAVTAAPLPDLADFKEYAPKVTATTGFQGERLRGEKVWDYVLIPLAAGAQTIPAVSFTYFDPKAREYRAASSAPIAIQVARAEGGSGPSWPAVSQSDVRLLRRDVHYIKVAPGGLSDRRGRFYRSPLFAALLLAPIAVDAGLFFWARRRDRSPGSLRLRRERRARSAARRRLKQARRSLSSATSRAFYAAVSQALFGYVADKSDTAAAGLTRPRIEEFFAARGVPAGLRARFYGCAEGCDYARFAPSSSAGGEMRRMLLEAEETLVALERALGA